MFGEEIHQSLPDHSGRSQHACAPLFLERSDCFPFLLAAWTLAIAPALKLRVHATSPEGNAQENSLGGPIRVPRACGLNVLRTHTTTSPSAASGSTLGCNTFAPLAASACAWS